MSPSKKTHFFLFEVITDRVIPITSFSLGLETARKFQRLRNLSVTWRWRTERFPEAGCYSRCIAKAQVLTSCHAFQELHHLQQDHINSSVRRPEV